MRYTRGYSPFISKSMVLNHVIASSSLESKMLGSSGRNVRYLTLFLTEGTEKLGLMSKVLSNVSLVI